MTEDGWNDFEEFEESYYVDQKVGSIQTIAVEPDYCAIAKGLYFRDLIDGFELDYMLDGIMRRGLAIQTRPTPPYWRFANPDIDKPLFGPSMIDVIMN